MSCLKSNFSRIMQSLALAAMAIAPNPSSAQPPRLEPGQAEARTTATTVAELPTTWTHPDHEVRAVWIVADDLLKPREEVRQKLQSLAAANINAIFVDTWFRGYVLYPGSKLVSQYPAAAAQGDPLKWIIDEAHALGLQVHSWPEYGCYAYHTKDSNDKSRGSLLNAHPELTAVAADGSSVLHNPTFGDFYSLCPANPKTFELLGDLYAEMMTTYDFDGLNLDRMRFPARDFCHCTYCRETFQKETSTPLNRFDEGTTAAQRWLEWKREKLANGVEHIVHRIRQADPTTIITAYVVGPDEMADKAQSWDLWMERGLLDRIAVSMYGDDIRPAAEKARKLLGTRSDRLMAAINAGLPDTAFLLRNIGWSRELAPAGQCIWHSATLVDDLHALKEGPYSQPAQW